MFEYRRMESCEEALPLAQAAFALRGPERLAVGSWLEQRLDEGRELYGIYEGQSLRAVYLLYPYRMRLRGSIVPMAGVGFVCSRMDARGTGAVRHMMAQAISTFRDRGFAVAVLDPFDQGFYRKYGWELFTREQCLEIASGGIHVPSEGSVYETADLPYPDPHSQAFYNAYASAHYNLIQRGPAEWRQRTELLAWHVDTAARGVVRVLGDSGVRGLLGYDLTRKAEEEAVFRVNLFLSESAGATRAMLRYLKGLSHQIKTIRMTLPLDVDLWPYLADHPLKHTIRDGFMIRIVSLETLDGLKIDAPAMSVRVGVTDAQAPWNQGVWQLEVRDRTLHVARAAEADVRCDIATLSSIVSGFTDFREMVQAGRAEAFAGYDGQDLPRTTTLLSDYF